MARRRLYERGYWGDKMLGGCMGCGSVLLLAVAGVIGFGLFKSTDLPWLSVTLAAVIAGLAMLHLLLSLAVFRSRRWAFILLTITNALTVAGALEAPVNARGGGITWAVLVLIYSILRLSSGIGPPIR